MTHLVSTVEGRLRAGRALAEILHATFPGGSITGAPKISAIDHIARLEPVGRGASMGAIGTIRANGDFELALTIRTFAVADGRTHLWVGGGIVWDSEPEQEVEESWVKARPLLAAVGGLVPRVKLLALAVAGRGLVDPAEPVFRADDEALLRGAAAFETLRVYGGRPFLLERHLERLRASCDALALPAPTAPRARRRASPQPRRRSTCCGSTGRERALVASAAELPAGLEEERARGISLRSVELRPGSARRREGDELRASPSPRARRERAGADDALLVAGGIVPRRRRRTSGGAGGELYTPAAGPACSPGVTRASALELTRGTDGRALALAELAAPTRRSRRRRFAR